MIMKIEDIKRNLRSFLNSYDRIYKDVSVKDDFDGTVLIPVKPDVAGAVKEVLFRINQRYSAATKEQYEWPRNLLFDLGFPIIVQLSDVNIKGLDYVIRELLTEKQREIILLIYKDDMDYKDAARKYGVTRQRIYSTVNDALCKMRDKSSMRLIWEGPDIISEYQEKSDEYRIVTEAYQKKIDFMRHNMALIDTVLDGKASPEEIQEMAVFAKEQEQNLYVELADLDLSVSAYKALKAAGFSRSGEFSGMSGKRLLKIRNFGRKALSELEEKLAEIGISLADSE